MNKRAEFIEVSKEQQDKIDLIRSSFLPRSRKGFWRCAK